VVVALLLLGAIAAVVLLVLRAGKLRRAQLLADAGPPVQWPPGQGPQPVHHPLGAQGWAQAGPGLVAAGLSRLDAENFTKSLPGMLSMLIVTFRPTDSPPSLRCLIDHECAGGVFETFLGTEANLRPGDGGANDLGKLVASRAGRLLSMLPPGATLSVTAPKLPGDKYKACLDTPFGAIEHPAMAARILLIIDELSRVPPAPGTRVQLPPIAVAWNEAAASLKALGLSRLDPETYLIELGSGYGQTMYLRLNVPGQAVTGSLDRPCRGGMLEAFLGQSARLRPGSAGATQLEQFVASQVGHALASLPPDASLDVQAPQLPGDPYRASITSSFASADVPAAVARVLLQLDKAAHVRAPAGMQAQLPRVAVTWQQAGPMLGQLGLKQLDPEVYIREMGGLRETLYVRLSVQGESVSASLDRTRPGGLLDRFYRARAQLSPGTTDGSPLAGFVASQVGELLGQLPPQAQLFVKAPDIPGDGYELRVTCPLQTPQQAAAAARVVLALDALAQRTG